MDVEEFRVEHEALAALEELRKITGRETITEVATDALRVYEWILQQQTVGRQILSVTGVQKEGVELASKIKAQDAAEGYFGEQKRNFPELHTHDSIDPTPSSPVVSYLDGHSELPPNTPEPRPSKLTLLSGNILRAFSGLAEATRLPAASRALVPAFYLNFYTLTVGTTAVFATLLGLRLFGIETIHPFLAGVGMLGGVGWLLPVMGDIREWKRRNGNR